MPVEIDVEHVARLARLELTAEELERFRRQLAVILEHAERVREIAAEEIPPTAQPVPRPNVFRSDEVRDGLTHQEAVAGAPQIQDGRFRVPMIVEREEG